MIYKNKPCEVIDGPREIWIRTDTNLKEMRLMTRIRFTNIAGKPVSAWVRSTRVLL